MFLKSINYIFLYTFLCFKGPIISKVPWKKFQAEESKTKVTKPIENFDLDNDSNANAKSSTMGKKFFGYKFTARLFTQGSTNAGTPVQYEELFEIRKRQKFFLEISFNKLSPKVFSLRIFMH